MCDFSHWPILSLLSPQVTSTIKFAVIFGTGKEAVFVTVDDKVWVTGGQNLAQPFLIDTLSNLGVIDIRPGFASMFIALTKNGEVYYCGLKNTFPAVPFVAEPTNRFGGLSDKKIVKVTCGISHAVAVTEAGEVFFWGNDSIQNQANPIKVALGVFVKDAECGHSFTILLSDNGQPYAFGSNNRGQLGIGNKINQQYPIKISGLEHVVVSQLACCPATSIVLTSEGHIYGCGYNAFGQLVTGDIIDRLSMIRIVTELECVCQIAAVNKCNLTAALTRTNQIYIWGDVLNQSFLKPNLTSFNNIDDVFSYFAAPPISFRPLINERTSANSTMGCYSESAPATNSLVGSLKSSFNDPETSDITFVIEEKQIHAHISLLKIRCEHFRLMFKEAAWLEGGKKEIGITQFSYPVYKAFLYYLYTDEMDITPESAVGLLDLATSYFEHELKLKCAEKIKKMISVENALMFYDASRSCNLNDLEEFCFSFCLKNTSAVTQTKHFKNLHDETLKHFVIEISKRGAFKN